MAVNIFRQTLVPTIGDVRQKNVAPRTSDPLPDPATGDLWIDMSQTPPVLKVLDGGLLGVAISAPPGAPTGTLQFNSAGAFAAVANSAVTSTGGVTLAQSANSPVLTINPAGTTTTGLVINNVNSNVIGMSLRRSSGGADLFRLLDIAGGTVLSMNADDVSTTPILKIAVEATVDKQALQLRRANAAATTDLFQIYDSGDTNVVFLVNPSGPTTGTVRIAPTVTNVTGLVINSSSNSTAQQLSVQNNGGAIFEVVPNTFNLTGATQAGVKVTSTANSIHLSTFGTGFDILLQTGPTMGARLVTASTYGTNDLLLQMVSATTGWSVYSNNITANNLGTLIETQGALPISIRPNRVETGQFPSGGGLVLFQAAPTVAAGAVGYGSTTATTANTGANGAPPAQVAGYLIVNIAGTARKIPFYVT